jgi:hypothetical protein
VPLDLLQFVDGEFKPWQKQATGGKAAVQIGKRVACAGRFWRSGLRDTKRKAGKNGSHDIRALNL